MKAPGVEHTVWVIDTLCSRCAWPVRVELAFSSLKCYHFAMLMDVRTTCLLDWIFETRWFQFRSVLRRFIGADRRDSLHLVSRVDGCQARKFGWWLPWRSRMSPLTKSAPVHLLYTQPELPQALLLLPRGRWALSYGMRCRPNGAG